MLTAENISESALLDATKSARIARCRHLQSEIDQFRPFSELGFIASYNMFIFALGFYQETGKLGPMSPNEFMRRQVACYVEREQ